MRGITDHPLLPVLGFFQGKGHGVKLRGQKSDLPPAPGRYAYRIIACRDFPCGRGGPADGGQKLPNDKKPGTDKEYGSTQGDQQNGKVQ